MEDLEAAKRFVRPIATFLTVMLMSAAALGQFVDKSADLRPKPGMPVESLAAAGDSSASEAGFRVDEQERQLRISLHGKAIVEFVFRDDKILRPYFANARLVNGVQVTRNHPPVKGVDELDHEKLHPGIWLAFGDINGHDFWRNQAAMQHLRFLAAPTIADGRLSFATECRLVTSDGQSLGLMTNHFTLADRPNGWLLVWSAEFHADQRAIVLGDQEEMGFGARVATAFTEKNGGVIRNSAGKQTAEQTWGQAANWCDYSGIGPRSGGIMLMASPHNFRESWWHNRDYGVFVANPFGRKAMQQGEASSITVAPSKTMRVTFGAFVHDHRKFTAAVEYELFRQLISR